MFTAYEEEHPFLRTAYILYAHLTAASAWRISCKFIGDVIAHRQRQIYIWSPSWSAIGKAAGRIFPPPKADKEASLSQPCNQRLLNIVLQP